MHSVKPIQNYNRRDLGVWCLLCKHGNLFLFPGPTWKMGG